MCKQPAATASCFQVEQNLWGTFPAFPWIDEYGFKPLLQLKVFSKQYKENVQRYVLCQYTRANNPQVLGDSLSSMQVLPAHSLVSEPRIFP